MEEYLTVKELSERIKFSRQSLYNLIHKGTFVIGKHYLKPTPKKVLFRWTEIQKWMGEPLNPQDDPAPDTDCSDSAPDDSDPAHRQAPPSLINI